MAQSTIYFSTNRKKKKKVASSNSKRVENYNLVHQLASRKRIFLGKKKNKEKKIVMFLVAYQRVILNRESTTGIGCCFFSLPMVHVEMKWSDAFPAKRRKRGKTCSYPLLQIPSRTPSLELILACTSLPKIYNPRLIFEAFFPFDFLVFVRIVNLGKVKKD